jgi:hypothetical protein
MIALLAGLGTVALSNAASITSGGFEGLVARWPVLATQVALVSLPFLVLALVLRFGRPAWLTAAVLTAIVWTLPAADHALRQGEGGANIGLGIFMLVSPLLVLGGALAASAAAGRRRK